MVVWGKLAPFAATLTKAAHIEVEGQLRQRTYQKQIAAGKKNLVVDMRITAIHASAIRKLDRNGAPEHNGGQDTSDEAPE